MTSKRLFFKAMREDLRHRIWMIALSVLGSFLAMPVFWLLLRNNMAGEMKLMRNENLYYIGRIYEFFEDYYMLCGGCIAVLGAFIVGLFGFRYLFRQGMVDTYHSLPVKRSTLFGVCYVDGFLIWFVPAFISMLSTVVMAGQFAYQMGGGRALGGMLKEAAISFAVLTAAFLLVYNMVLVAVMLSGNVLNALVAMAILGFGALAVYSLGLMFFSIYMETFYIEAFPREKATYFSPFFSALYLLFARCGVEDDLGELWSRLLITLSIAAALGVCTWFLYKRRASELAEQGICNKAVGTVMKAAAGIAAGMCGWQLFVMLVLNTEAVGWGIFGVVLGTVFTFGILDIIFQMEFRAFFAHKIQITVTLAVTLLICFAFYREWFNYDVYLPDKDEIAEIAVFDVQFTNRFFCLAQDSPLENMVFRDTETIYTYLEAMTATQAILDTEMAYDIREYDLVRTKVTLKNGRSYYRNYYVLGQDKEKVWPLFVSQEYMKYAYCMEEEWAAQCSGVVLTRKGESVRLNDFKPETLSSIIRAYNEDVLADPEAVLLGEGRLLARMEVILWRDGNQEQYTLDIYESMEHVLEALRLAGYQNWIALTEASDIRSVELSLRVYAQDTISKDDVITRAREVYGVYGEKASDQVQEAAKDQGIFAEEISGGVFVEEISDEEISEEGALEEGASAAYPEAAAEDWAAEDYKDYAVSVTDRAEVEELLALASYVTPYRGGNVFREDYAEILIEDINGNTQIYYIRKGLLPEKYILRFGERL